MGRNDQLQHLGTVYSKTTTGMTTAYTAGTTQYTGQAIRLTLYGRIVLAAGTSVTSYSIKVMILDASGNAYPIGTTQNDASLTTSIEQSIAVTANATTPFILQTESIAATVHGWQVQAKANGGAGTTNESITVTADVS